MREIKFRAWDEKRKNYLCSDEFLVPYNGEVYEIVSCDNCSDYLTVNHESTLEQYTGLHDMNGREIYEGDIVETIPMSPGDDKITDLVNIGIVKFIEDGYWIENFNWAIGIFKETIRLKVIGNVHENPELLEGK